MGSLFCCFKKDIPSIDTHVKDNKCCIDEDCRCFCCLVIINKNDKKKINSNSDLVNSIKI